MAGIRAIGGTVAGLGLVGAGVAGLGLAGEDNSTRNEAGQVVVAGDVGAFRIRVGDCFPMMETGELESVRAVPCSQPHVHEVVGAFNLPYPDDAAFIGQAAIESHVAEQCPAEFARYVGISYEYSQYYLGVIRPTAESWAELDDREVLCTATTQFKDIVVGSIKGSGQ
jgi:hypothetical protein